VGLLVPQARASSSGYQIHLASASCCCKGDRSVHDACRQALTTVFSSDTSNLSSSPLSLLRVLSSPLLSLLKDRKGPSLGLCSVAGVSRGKTRLRGITRRASLEPGVSPAHIGYARPVTGPRPGRPRHGHCFLINLSLSLSLSRVVGLRLKSTDCRSKDISTP